MAELVAVDIGGTHARFALAEVADGRVVALHPETVLRTADHRGLEQAWATFAATLGRAPPRAAAFAVAGPVGDEELRFTNNPWIIRPAKLDAQLGLDRHLLINDFAAIAHAVSIIGPGELRHLCGPDQPLPATGVISVTGPGTGLGVAMLLRDADGRAHVIATEAGHIGFAPVDATDDAIFAYLRRRHRRVSAERLVSGPGLLEIHAALASTYGPAIGEEKDEIALWQRAMSGDDVLAAAALDRFCLCLGTVAGDLALAQGASAVVIAGGVGLRLADHLPRSGFAERFVAKGRFEPMMAAMPIRMITHPQPGLLGAAAAFAQRFG